MRLEIDNKPFTQFILILSLCLISVVVFSIIGTLAAALIYGFNPTEVNNLGSPNVISGMRLIQLFSAIGLFVFPPLIYGRLTAEKPIQKLGLNPVTHPFNYILILILMVVSTPFLSWLIELNTNMVLPDFMSGIERWMRDSEYNAAQATKAFLTFDGVGSLLYILLIVAIVPAIGEELLFRGVLQKIVINWSKNGHLGIWITATVFSALHMQFFGFFPRLLLGVLFGYVFYWSKSLWVPILGHFINNGSVVIASYFYPEKVNNTDVSIFGNHQNSMIIYIISFIFTMVIFFLMWKVNRQQNTSS